MTLCFAAVFALGLAACSSSSDDPPPDDTTMMPDPEPDPIDVERTAIASAIAAASAAAAGINDASDDAAVAAADMAVADAMAAISGATHISAAEVTAANAQVAAIQSQLAAAKSSRTMAMTLASQRMAIADALAAATTAVGAVNDDSDDATVSAAEDAIAAATAAIHAAADISLSEAQAENAKVAALQASLDSAKASRQMAMDAAAAERQAAMEAEARRTEQVMAINTAIDAARTAVAAVNDESTQDQVDAANAAVANARAKIAEAADVADDVKATHTASVDALATSLSNAETSRQMAMAASQELANQRASISNAISAARTAVNAVNDDSTDEQVEAAEDAIADARLAIAGASDVPAEEKAANTGTVDAIMANLNTAKESRMAAIEAAEKAAEAERMAKAATGKALKGALGSNPLGHLDRTTNAGGSVLAATGLTVDQTQGTLAADPPAVTLRAGDSAGSLGDWGGTHYAHTNLGTKVSNSAIVYTNQAEPKTYSIATRYATAGNIPTSGGDYTPGTGGKGTLSLAADSADKNIKADMFPTAGTKTFTATDPATEILVSGTYHGAPGTYRCTGTCTATMTADGISLSEAWVFAHGAGAMVSVADSTYLYFGWWLTQDKDDKPTAASAFHGEFGDVEGGTALTGINAIVGTAKYVGHAAGKFAISDPLSGGDAGHFTADATLNAKFSGAGAGISGTIDNFMANDESVPWSVALNNTGTTTAAGTPTNNIGADGTIATIADNTDTATVNESRSTVWSIDGTAAPASGTWNGRLYDEALAPAAVSDGSNVPTSVTGVFQSHFGSTHTMVGAFGATAE